MKSRLPILLILALTGMWLLLNGTIAVGQIVLGLGVSTLMVYGYRAVRPVLPHVHRPQKALLLLWLVFVDIVRSNVAVARIVLGLNGRRAIRSGFLEVPLEMRDPYALAALAAIVTSTPGTIWAGLSQDSATLTLHVLDLRDEREAIDTFKRRYEPLLMEIFE